MTVKRVKWNGLDPATYEDMCSVLISRLHPAAQRIDGTGGDGGRDVQVPTEGGGPIIYEMKSFTGRLSAARRTQIRKSLDNAAKHNPSAWNLLVPIDPTPSELEWFDELTRNRPFECRWLGLTWLDQQMASHGDIPRYYLHGSSDEIVEVLRELAQEQAALTRGVPDAIERMKALSARANSLDPHYSFGLAVDKDGRTSVSVWPKYVGAEHDRPINLNASFSFPDSDVGRAAASAFKDTLDYGLPSVVSGEFIKRLETDIPAGLGGDFSGGELRFGQADDDPGDLTAQWRVLNESGRTISQLPLTPVARSAGAKGGSLKLVDLSGHVEVTLRVNMTSQRINAHFSYTRPAQALPSAALPALKFIANVRPPNSAVLLINGKEATPPTPIDQPIAPDIADYLWLIEALDDIQRATGVYFPIPDSFTDDEADSIDTARRLLAGEAVQSSWSTMKIQVPGDGLASFRAAIEQKPGPLVAEAELTIHVAGQEIPLGLTRQTSPSVAVAEWPSPAEGAEVGQFVEITLRPGEDSSVTTVLIQKRTMGPEGLGQGRDEGS